MDMMSFDVHDKPRRLARQRRGTFPLYSGEKLSARRRKWGCLTGDRARTKTPDLPTASVVLCSLDWVEGKANEGKSEGPSTVPAPPLPTCVTWRQALHSLSQKSSQLLVTRSADEVLIASLT